MVKTIPEVHLLLCTWFLLLLEVTYANKNNVSPDGWSISKGVSKPSFLSEDNMSVPTSTLASRPLAWCPSHPSTGCESCDGGQSDDDGSTCLSLGQVWVQDPGSEAFGSKAIIFLHFRMHEEISFLVFQCQVNQELPWSSGKELEVCPRTESSPDLEAGPEDAVWQEDKVPLRAGVPTASWANTSWWGTQVDCETNLKIDRKDLAKEKSQQKLAFAIQLW